MRCIHTHTHTHTHTMIYYSVIKKNEIMPFVATWMDLDIVILSDLSQIEEKYHMISHICGIKEMIQMSLFTKYEQTHRLRE